MLNCLNAAYFHHCLGRLLLLYFHLGVLFVNGQFYFILLKFWFVNRSGKDCVNVQLVQKGVARLNDMAFAPSSIRSDLEKAEKEAQEKRLGLWALASAFESLDDSAATQTSNQVMNLVVPTCIVTQCNNVNDFYIQELPASNIEDLQTKVANHIESLTELQALGEAYTQASLPTVGQIVLAKFSEDETVGIMLRCHWFCRNDVIRFKRMLNCFLSLLPLLRISFHCIIKRKAHAFGSTWMRLLAHIW